MKRRKFIGGLGAVALGTALAGCSSDSGSEEPTNTTSEEPEPTPEQADILPTGVERIEEMFHHQLDQNLHHGAQLAVYKDGELVVDLADGVTGPDGDDTTTDTRHILFSTTKPYTAGCVHHLVDEGELAYDDYVVDHWPEFADGDERKEDVTIRHVLSHQSGLHSIPSIDNEHDVWNKPDEKERRVEQAELAYEPGSDSDYHLLSYGWIIDGLVRNVTGKQIDEVAAEAIFDPLGMDNTSIGVEDAEEVDVATLVGFEPHDQTEELSDSEVGYNAYVADLFNSAHVQESVVGAATGIGTANDLARFYQALLDDGEDVFSADTVEAWREPQVEQKEDGGDYTRRSMGFHLTAGHHNSYGVTAPHTTFGHGGLGSIMTWADPVNDIAFAYVTNGIRDDFEHYNRVSTMSDVVREELS